MLTIEEHWRWQVAKDYWLWYKYFLKFAFKGVTLMQCDICGSDNTQRLQVIYENGTESIDARTTSTLSLRTSTTRGTSQTITARKATPPQKQSFTLPLICIGIGLYFLLIGLMASSNIVSIITIIGVAIIGTGIYYVRKTIRYNSLKWPKLYQYWQECWMCHKCGNIYHYR